MSAYIVDKQLIDYIVRAAESGIRGPSPSNPPGNLRWFDCPPDHDWSLEEMYSHSKKASEAGPDYIGQELVCENVQSIRYRYPDVDSGGSAPGPIDEYWREPYSYSRPMQRKLSAAQLLDALSEYEYQACEHPGWRTSEAWQIVDALRGLATSELRENWRDAVPA